MESSKYLPYLVVLRKTSQKKVTLFRGTHGRVTKAGEFVILCSTRVWSTQGFVKKNTNDFKISRKSDLEKCSFYRYMCPLEQNNDGPETFFHATENDTDAEATHFVWETLYAQGAAKVPEMFFAVVLKFLFFSLAVSKVSFNRLFICR